MHILLEECFSILVLIKFPSPTHSWNLDPTNRLSLREAVSHPYLTNGAMETTEGHLHLSLDPLTLHLSAPSVTLPIRTSKESEEEVDGSGKATDCPATEEHLWARRQFSILWAPMPASFSSAKEVSYLPTSILLHPTFLSDIINIIS